MTAVRGWVKTPLGQIASLIKGISYASEDYCGPGEGAVFITIKCVSKAGGFKSEGIKYFKGKIADSQELHRGDLLIANTDLTRAGDIVGAPILVPLLGGETITMSMDLSKIVEDETKVDRQFLYYKLMTDPVRRFMKDHASGSTVLHLQTRAVPTLELDIPTAKPEQTKIAEILSTVDQAIEQAEALIAKQQCIKTGLMQDLLTRGIDDHGKLRSEQTHEFKDSPLGRVPREWQVQSLGTALHKAHGFLQTGPFGSQLHAHEYVPEGIPVIMPQDILLGRISTAMIARITEQRANDLRRHRLQPNDIVFSRRGDLARAAAIGKRETGWLCGTGCFLLRVPAKQMEARWLADVYRHHYVRRQVETNAVGSTMPSLNNTVMEQLTIAYPSVDEQREITRRRDSIDATIQAMDGHLRKLVLLKTGLMQDLLSGNRRVTALLPEPQVASA